jgi:hypothetical protein
MYESSDICRFSEEETIRKSCHLRHPKSIYIISWDLHGDACRRVVTHGDIDGCHPRHCMRHHPSPVLSIRCLVGDAGDAVFYCLLSKTGFALSSPYSAGLRGART